MLRANSFGRIGTRRNCGHSRHKNKLTTAVLSAAAVAGLGQVALGQVSATWISAVNGTWSVNSNWTGGAFPTGGGAATFSVAGTVSVTLDTNVSLGTINFTTGSYTIAAGGGSITMVGPALLNATTGTSTINADISTAGTFTKIGAGTLILNGNNSMAALHAGVGTLIVNTALPANIPLTIGGFTSSTGHLLLGSNPASFSSITMPYNNAGTTGGTLSTAAELTLNGNVTYTPNYGGAGSTPLNIVGGGSLNLGASNRTFNVQYHNNASGDVQVGLNIVGAGGIVKTNTGTLALNNATSSFAGGVDVQGGALFLGADPTGGPGAVTGGPAGTGVISLGEFTALRSTTGGRIVNNNITGNGAFIIGSVSIGGTINFPGAARGISAVNTATINGAITHTGAQPLPFGNNSTGTVVVISNPGYTMPTELNSGTLNLQTATGQLVSSSAYTINAGTMLVTTGTVANRFNDTGAMNLSGGSLIFSGSVAAGGYTEAMGDLNVANANSYLALTTSSGTAQGKLSFTNVTRANRATATIAGTSLGQQGSFVASSTFSNAYVKISNAANEAAFVGSLVGGGAGYGTTTLNNSIVPWLSGSTSGTGTAATFLTYEGTNGTGVGSTGAGFIALATGNYDTAIPAANPTNNVRVASGSINVAADTTINSLVLAGGTLTGTAKVTLTSGAMLASSAGTISTAFAAPGEMFVHNATVTTNLTGTLTASSGLTKGGTGTLILGGDNSATLVGDVIVNGGTLQFSADNQLGAPGNGVKLYQSAALNYAGTTDLTTARTITTASTSPAFISLINVANSTVTLNASSPIAGASGGFAKIGSGTLIASIAPSMSSLVAARGGNLVLTGDNSASTGTTEIGSTGTLRVSATNNFTGGVALFSGGTLVPQTDGAISKSFHYATSSTIDTGTFSPTLSGNITDSTIPGLARPASLTKQGSGTLTFTGTHSQRVGNYNVGSGQMVFAGAGGSALNVGSFSVAAGAKFILDNTTLNTDRLRNDATITLTGGTTASELIFRGNASTMATETLGALSMTAGGTDTSPGSIVTVDPNGSTGGTVLTFASLSSGSFSLFRGINLGVDPTTLTPGTPYTQIFFTTPPTLTGGGFIAGARYDDSLTGLGIGSVTYSNLFGIQLFTIGTFSGNRINNGAPENVPTGVNFITSGDTTFVGNAATIAQLTVGTTTSTVSLDPATSTGSLNITGGAIVINTGNAGGVTFGPGAGAASVNFGSAGTINAGSNVTFNLPLAGTLGFGKGGAATATLTIANTITGPLTVSAGTLVFDNATKNTVTSLSGSGGTIAVGAGAALAVTAAGTYSGAITGSGSVILETTAAATISFDSANNYTGGTAIGTAAGTLATVQLGNPAALGTGSVTFGNTTSRVLLRTNFASGTVSNNFTLAAPGGSFATVASNQVATFSGVISGGAGTATFRVSGPTDDSSVIVLAGNNSGLSVGTIDIFEGQLGVTSAAALGSATTISLNSLTSVAGGSLGGLRLDGSNITLPQNLNFVDGNVINTQANDGTLTGQIVGTGTFGKAGSGKLTLTNAANTNTGTIFVNAGELNVRGNVGSGANPVNVAAGATLSGSGTLTRPINVAAGGIVAPGNSVGVITVGSLSLNSATLSYESDGVTLDRIDMSSTLSLAGTSVLNLSGPALAAGVYTLMNYGTFGGAGTISLGTTLGGAFNYNLIFNPTNLTLNIDVVATAFTWDADPGTAGIQDGSGTWETGGTANFFNNTSLTNQPWANSFTSNVTFGSTGGGFTVTVDAPVQANRITFAQPYTVIGAGVSLRSGMIANADGTLSSALTMESSNSLEVAAGQTLRVLGGVGEGTTGLQLSKAGAGTLILGGTASYTGQTNLNGGTTVISAANQISGGTLAMANGTLLTTSTLVGSQTISLSGALNAIAVESATSHTRAAPIVGTGALTKLGDGSLILTAPGTYTGGTTIAAGVITVDTGGALPTTGTLTLAGGVQLNLSNGVANTVGTISGAAGSTISIAGPSSLNIAPASGTQTVNSTIIGTGSLSFNPVAAGTLTLGGDNTFSGGLNVGTIATVIITDENALGSGSVTFNTATARALLRVATGTNSVVNLANDFTLAAVAGSFSHAASGQVTTLTGQLIGGAGTATFRVTGTADDTGVFVLPNANPNLTVGTISIFEGQLAIGTAASLGSAGTIAFNTTTTIASGSLGGLRLDGANITVGQNLLFLDSNVINTQANDGTLAGVMSGSGAFGKAGAGKLSIVNASNTHTGTIFLNAGELNVRAPGVIGASSLAVNVAAGARLSGDGTINRQVITVAGAEIAPGNSVGTLTAGSASLTSTNLDIEINAPSADVFAVTGTLTLAGSSTLNLSGTLAAGSFDFMTFGSISGAGSVTLGTAPNGFGYIIGSDADSYFVQVGLADYVWDTDAGTANPQDGGGTWSTGSNFWENFGSRNYAWQNDAANAVTFGTAGGSGAVVTVDGAKTVKSLSFVQNYTLNGTDPINVAAGITASESATVNAPINMLASQTFAVAAGKTLNVGVVGESSAGLTLTKDQVGTLVLNAPATHTGGTNVNAGALVAERLRNGTLTIAAGAQVQITPKGAPNSPAGTSVMPALNIAGTPAVPTGKLDLANNALVIDYTTVGTLVDDVRQLLAAGTGGVVGITSSSATVSRRLGYGDNSVAALGVATFNGVAVDATSLLMMFTVAGDANLNGTTNIGDFSLLASNFNQPGVWTSGDFNYDGTTNIGDFSLLAANFNTSLPAGMPRGSLVPEPAVAAGVLATGLLARRRNRR